MKKFSAKFEKIMKEATNEIKIGYTEYNDFVKTFYSDEKYKQLRFGQGFIAYMKEKKNISITNPELFYTTNKAEAEKMIADQYIDQDR